MEKRKGQVVMSTLVTPTTDKKFAVVDSNDIGGGRYLAKTISERNKIPPALRRAGMICYVEETDSDYKLLLGFPENTNLSNDNWVVYNEPLEEVEFPHQKVEEIQYASETAKGFTTLLQKLNDIDNELTKKLENHQAVEDMTYANQIDGYNSLIGHIRYLSTSIRNLLNGSNLYIENINYQFTPNDTHNHRNNLADEIEQIYGQMNNADSIVISINGQRSSLSSKLSSFSTQITNMNNPDYIEVSEDTSLSGKLEAIDQAITNVADSAQQAVQHIEDISYTTTPQGRSQGLKGELDSLFTGIDNINQVLNKPDSIVVDTKEVDNETVDVSLNDKLSEIANDLTNIRNSFKVENISWNSTPEDHENTLSNELNSIYSQISSINTSLGQIQNSGSNNTDNISNIQSSITTIQGSISAINTSLADMNDPSKIEVANDKSLTTKLSEIDTSLADMNDPSKIEVANDKSLTTKLSEIDTSLADMNDPSKIEVANDKSLTTKLSEIDSSLNSLNIAAQGAVQHIEDISYTTTPQGRSQGLKGELDSLFTGIDNINQVLNKPDSIEVANDKSLTTKLSEIDSSLNSLNIAAQGAVQHIEDISYTTTPQGRSQGLKGELDSLFTGIDNINQVLNKPDSIEVANDKSLTTKLSEIDTSLADMNDPSKIEVANDKSLTTKLSEIDTSLADMNRLPRFLLFSVSNLVLGVIKGQEYLVDKASKITNVTLYTDANANLDDAISIKVQKASTTGSYTDIGTYTLATNDTNLISSTDLQTPIELAVNDRVRVSISSVGSSSEINSFSVRLSVIAND